MRRTLRSVEKKIYGIWNRDSIPGLDELSSITEKTLRLLQTENADIRPPGSSGVSGGYVCLSGEIIPSVIVPDLHGRGNFVLNVLKSFPGVLSDFFSARCTGTILDLLYAGEINLIFLGDAFHSESRGRLRWIKAYKEFLTGKILSKYMLSEMKENFSVMEMIMLLKNSFPRNVHFLKGNHENIKNSFSGGNYPFCKFTDEGEMTRVFTEKYFGSVFLDLYAEMELSLPVFISGPGFLVSHSEPARFFPEEEIINARQFPEVVAGLTWTDNGSASVNAVPEMLSFYQRDFPEALYFGGHRPVSDRYALRAAGRFVQIHNPDKQNVAVVCPGEDFCFSKNICPVE